MQEQIHLYYLQKGLQSCVQEFFPKLYIFNTKFPQNFPDSKVLDL
jgi:hypothetical protein